MNNNNTYEIETLSGIIERASCCLHSTIKYVYAVSMGDFYNINVKDLFKVSLSDISNPDILTNLGLSLDSAGSDSALENEEFRQVRAMIFYAFSVRVGFLRRIQEVKIKDRFLRELFESCIAKGAEDSAGVIKEDFKLMLKFAKNKHPEPPFNGEWFRRWVYSCGGELAAITNRNMFLLGCIDALLPLYYAKLTDILTDTIIENNKPAFTEL